MYIHCNELYEGRVEKAIDICKGGGLGIAWVEKAFLRLEWPLSSKEGWGGKGVIGQRGVGPVAGGWQGGWDGR